MAHRTVSLSGVFSAKWEGGSSWDLGDIVGIVP